MRASLKMKQIIEQIAAKHGVNLMQADAYLRLEMTGYDRLVIENVGRRRISVAHYWELNGDAIAEPDIVFFAGTDGCWYPLEITQSLTGYHELAQVERGRVTVLDQQRQRDVAYFGNVWGVNIREQGWLERGRVTGIKRGKAAKKAA